MAALDYVLSANDNDNLDEKQDLDDLANPLVLGENPVIESARTIISKTNHVFINNEGVENAAKYVARKLDEETYTPTTWRTHPLHLLPPSSFSPTAPETKLCLDWIFLISSLNFSFWSKLEGKENAGMRYGVEWKEGWGMEGKKVHTGYWSLVGAINKALESGIPITDPAFYSSPDKCPDSIIASIFAPAESCAEGIPLLEERVAILRENGAILCEEFDGSFSGFLTSFTNLYGKDASALNLVQMITDTFPSFRDESTFDGSTVFFWKRAQILVAETWAAFYPLSEKEEHPFFPAGVNDLTMFADYRVPQILHHLGILTYSTSLETTLKGLIPLENGSEEEMAIRAGSILAVEKVRDAILRHAEDDKGFSGQRRTEKEVSSVLIDFYLWDLAKRIERGDEVIEGVTTQEVLPAHRTRSIWY